ncbi:MerR family transcriptional regulator [Streptomyces sp. CA-111067]|uniref:MerR family transcriptional regulator n=1 Tax=Streptomyces sp. CA-111067 TaxID=3240046 RepID=UPI003D954322
MRIGELAALTGASVRSLRHYEQAGLLESDRAPNGYRVYPDLAAARVRNIRFLLGAGLTLDDVRLFLPCLDGDMTTGPVPDRALAVAAGRLAVLDARIAAQTAVRDRLAAVLRQAAGERADPGSATGRTRPAGPSHRTEHAEAGPAHR